MDTFETLTTDGLEAACLDALKGCEGFEGAERVVVAPRERSDGGANWVVAAVRPKVPSSVLRGARPVIDRLQENYRLAA